MILSFVCAGLAALGLLCCTVWYHGGTVIGADMKTLSTLTGTEELIQTIAYLVAAMNGLLAEGALMAFAYRYLKAEEADGTPFTEKGARQVLRLGIRTIVFPMIALGVSASACAIWNLPMQVMNDWSNAMSAGIGIMMIVSSLIFRYGAELEKLQKEKA